MQLLNENFNFKGKDEIWFLQLVALRLQRDHCR